MLPLINLSIGVSILVNAVHLFADGTRIKALGEFVSAAIAIVVSVAVLDVFPFDYSGHAFPWEWLVRFVFVIAVIGSGVCTLVNERLSSIERERENSGEDGPLDGTT